MFLLILAGTTCVSLWLIWILARRYVSELAGRKERFTFRVDNKIQYIVDAEPKTNTTTVTEGRIVRAIMKSDRYNLDRETYGITRVTRPPAPGAPPPAPGTPIPVTVKRMNSQQTLTEFVLGAHWVGWWPREIMTYEITYMRPFEPKDEELMVQHPGKYKIYKPTADYWVTERVDITDHHRVRSVYSFFIPDIEIKGVEFVVDGKTVIGQVLISIFGTFAVETVNAYMPVGVLHGKWFPHVLDGMRGGVGDQLAGKTIDEIRTMKKSPSKKGRRPAIERAILRANKGPGGIIATTGMKIVAVNVGGFQIEAEIAKAQSDLAKATIDAATLAAQGKGEGDRRKEIAKGDAELANALAGHPEAAAVLIARARVEEARELKDLKTGVTLVQGGASAGVLISNKGGGAGTT